MWVIWLIYDILCGSSEKMQRVIIRYDLRICLLITIELSIMHYRKEFDKPFNTEVIHCMASPMLYSRVVDLSSCVIQV